MQFNRRRSNHRVESHPVGLGLADGLGSEGSTPTSDGPTAVPVSVSRRNVLKKLGAGGLAVAAPALGLGAMVKPENAQEDRPALGPRGRVRQWGMIIDLRRCDGCQSQGTPPQCTLACIEGHLAPEPMEWIEIYENEMSGGGTQFLPTPCQQCENPPCVNVCPVAATYSQPDGIVAIDQERCIGCRLCMAACPYDRRFFNWGTAPVPPEALLADYSPAHQVPAKRGTVMKCDFCTDLVRAGSLPQCVQACPQDAIYYGDLEEDIATNGVEVVGFQDYLTRNNTYRLKEDLGTRPRVHYIPGHGEDVGRDPESTGRLPTEWPWADRAKGAVTWER
ncbi:MAG: 4Fe-4S dicluster domain-containing protein [Actinobacteria bacterium]|nr:4Fe-4S dicluster domain-containing protein [Actinomycetota bacterium]